jgi:hypothetical protein
LTPVRRIVVALLVVATAISAGIAHAQAGVDIAGYYEEHDGTFFRIIKSGAVYSVLWRQKAGDWIGVAIRDGENLAVGWQRSDGKNLGVSFYKIVKGEKGPTLVGAWAAYPGGGLAPDTMKWSRPLQAAPAAVAPDSNRRRD